MAEKERIPQEETLAYDFSRLYSSITTIWSDRKTARQYANDPRSELLDFETFTVKPKRTDRSMHGSYEKLVARHSRNYTSPALKRASQEQTFDLNIRLTGQEEESPFFISVPDARHEFFMFLYKDSAIRIKGRAESATEEDIAVLDDFLTGVDTDPSYKMTKGDIFQR